MYLEEAEKEAMIGMNNQEGGPFGAVIIDKNKTIIAKAHNQVLKTNDPTAHAEILAIRMACKKLNTKNLSDCIIYSTCEPCPMCLSAIIWANIKKVYYGSNRKDASKAGFKDDDIYEYLSGNNQLLEKIEINNKNCKDLFKKYDGEVY
ncbi:MAG TPA: nucleoside deaminase [Candidatus Faecimonas gallistercoris]|nr:nucleoside deaminase [Candidatus Faecimonas gallistercoris]